jgi:VIT1/CCC1 family predicted Fe2+/Mn2+ transporter
MTFHTHVHRHEPHNINISDKTNRIRAAVLGANDGIVSIAGLVVGVAGATNDKTIILTAGVAGIIAGALSMAAGEYVSVSTQRDTEKALLEKERKELEDYPEEELEELVKLYQQKGLERGTAFMVAKELTAKDAFGAHVDIELGIDPNHLVNPWQSACASAGAFVAGSLIPLAAIILPLGGYSVIATFLSVIIALTINGYLSAKYGESNARISIMRTVTGGVLAMTSTYLIGYLFNVTGI